MKKVLILFFFLISISSASGDYTSNEVDCIVIKEENSIICKYISERASEDRFINVQWLAPNGDISRTRKILFPSGHGSVYDFRYLNGREAGLWTFKVFDNNKEFKIEFEINVE